jgi:hypothetical protein
MPEPRDDLAAIQFPLRPKLAAAERFGNGSSFGLLPAAVAVNSGLLQFEMEPSRGAQPGTAYTPQCMLKPIFASSYQAGILCVLKDSHVGWYGPSPAFWANTFAAKANEAIMIICFIKCIRL